VCEFLHCTPSELEKRLRKGNGLVDEFLILSYVAKKAQLEQDAVERAKTQGSKGGMV
jgi:hypothetical protein